MGLLGKPTILGNPHIKLMFGRWKFFYGKSPCIFREIPILQVVLSKHFCLTFTARLYLRSGFQNYAVFGGWKAPSRFWCVAAFIVQLKLEMSC